MVKNIDIPMLVIMVYIFYNLVYALSSLPIGIIADKTGLKINYIFGLIIFAVVYGSMAANPGIEFVLFYIFPLRNLCGINRGNFKSMDN